MDAATYKEQKLDKLTRDVVKMVNQTPSFGQGEVVDVMAKNALTNYLLTVLSISEIREMDFEILAQSIFEELIDLNMDLITKIKIYKKNLEENS